MKALIVIGSNCGDRIRNIDIALDRIGAICTIIRLTKIYESPDLYGSKTAYMNCIAEIETSLSENNLIYRFKEIELQLGRTEECKQKNEVPLDIDIVVWEEQIRRSADYKASYFQKGMELFNN